jgi:hypothetical protein
MMSGPEPAFPAKKREIYADSSMRDEARSLPDAVRAAGLDHSQSLPTSILPAPAAIFIAP